MPKTTIEHLKSNLPVFILAGSLIAGWVKLEMGLSAVTASLEKHCMEATAQESVTDAALTALEKDGDVTDIHIAEMKKDIEYMQADLESLLSEQRTATAAILAKLNKGSNND
jgi:phenylpyruvate tautomerase PptA (4-oxalocrotonate tautomerase family)